MNVISATSVAEADQEAQKLIKPFLGKVAWPSVIFGLGCIFSFASVTTLAVLGTIPLWLGLVFNTLILYATQTPLHEACHGNIAGRDARWMWLNHLIGFVCGVMLLHEYKAFRALHLMHHRDTNDAEFDPDHWVKVTNPLQVLLRCLTIVPYYNYFFFKQVALNPDGPGNKETAIHVIGTYWALYTLAFWLTVSGYALEVLALWFGPHILGSALIIYFFAYLVHQPHDATERYRDTNIFKVSGPFARIVNWLYCFQNYHLIHHLYPRIPFFLYPEAFDEVKPILKRQGAHIREFGHQ